MKRLVIVPLVLLVAASGLRAQKPAPQKPAAKQPASKQPASDTSDAQQAATADSVLKLVQKGVLPTAVPPKGARVPPNLEGLVDEWLRGPATGKQADSKLDYLRAWLGNDLLRQQFADVAADTTEPPLVRARALIALGAEHPTSLAAFDYGLSDAAPTVRAAAAVGLKPLVLDPRLEQEAVGELRRGLRDPSPVVVSRALDALGDRDAAALREFLAARPDKTLATIAAQLLELAESRGAPLVPRDSTGQLSRETAGTTLEFTPSQRWPDWDMAVGTLRVRRGSAAPVTLASGVEVVRNVMPAVISADGRYVAYETADHIHVRDLERGADRDLGAGIAPRVAPMAPGFLFARPGAVTPKRDHDALEYGIMFVGWAGGDAREVARATADARQLVHGNASGMRWARIVEGDGYFVLTGDGLAAPVKLPDLAALHG